MISTAFDVNRFDKIVKNRYDKEDKFKNFHIMKKHYGKHMDPLCRKGFCPYEWVGGKEKLDYEGIPPMEAVHSQLKNESALYDDDEDTKTMKRRRIRKPSLIKSRVLS